MEGPAVVPVPVVCPISKGKLENLWVLDDSEYYGVKVVETPLNLCVDDTVAGDRHGTLTAAVELELPCLLARRPSCGR